MTEGLKVKDLLPVTLDHLEDEAKRALCDDKDGSLPLIAWNYVASELAESIRDVLDIDLFELLAKGWANGKLLMEYADPSKHRPGERLGLNVGEYSYTRELFPTVEVTFGSLPCSELKFTLELTGHFSGLHLTIIDGHIVSGRSGEAWASGKLSYKGIPLGKEEESQKLSVPLEFKFKAPGVPIPRLP